MSKVELIYNQYRDIALAKDPSNAKFFKPFSELTEEEIKAEAERQEQVIARLKELLFG